MKTRELKTLLKENNIPFFAYWDKKRLTAVASKFLDTSSYTVYYWENKDGVWKNKYKIIVT